MTSQRQFQTQIQPCSTGPQRSATQMLIALQPNTNKILVRSMWNSQITISLTLVCLQTVNLSLTEPGLICLIAIPYPSHSFPLSVLSVNCSDGSSSTLDKHHFTLRQSYTAGTAFLQKNASAEAFRVSWFEQPMTSHMFPLKRTA